MLRVTFRSNACHTPTLKQQKIAALQVLKVNINEYVDPQQAVLELMSNHKNATAGFFSKRTADLLNKISGAKSKERNGMFCGMSMSVLGGFLAVLGTAAVAVAFVALNAATFGLLGVVVAGSGMVALLTGIGLFATSRCRGVDAKLKETGPFKPK